MLGWYVYTVFPVASPHEYQIVTLRDITVWIAARIPERQLPVSDLQAGSSMSALKAEPIQLIGNLYIHADTISPAQFVHKNASTMVH